MRVGEIALAQGDAATAAEQISRALDIHRTLDVPFDREEIGMRAGVALAAAGEREGALERLDEAYRGARRLGSRLLAVETAREVAALGESVAGRLGRRAEADAEGAGLSRRELEVVRLVAVGRTNREIAQELYLSPRTVDMHVRNILRQASGAARASRPPTGRGSSACSSEPGPRSPQQQDELQAVAHGEEGAASSRLVWPMVLWRATSEHPVLGAVRGRGGEPCRRVALPLAPGDAPDVAPGRPAGHPPMRGSRVPPSWSRKRSGNRDHDRARPGVASVSGSREPMARTRHPVCGGAS